MVLAKTAYSPLLKSAGDYSCGVFDVQGEMVRKDPTCPFTSARCRMLFAPLSPCLDRTYTMAMFYPQRSLFRRQPSAGRECGSACILSDALLGYTCLRAHWPDIGSATPGSYGAVTQIFGEGLRIPPLRLISRGVLNMDLEKLILANVRTPTSAKAIWVPN